MQARLYRVTQLVQREINVKVHVQGDDHEEFSRMLAWDKAMDKPESAWSVVRVVSSDIEPGEPQS